MFAAFTIAGAAIHKAARFKKRRRVTSIALSLSGAVRSR
jgi:hypothetical protein